MNVLHLKLRSQNSIFLILLVIGVSIFFSAREKGLRSHTKIKNFRQTRRLLNPKHLDSSLLEQTIIDFTNQARKRHNLRPCKFDSKLMSAAQTHSQEMARLRYLSHISQTEGNTRLLDRLKNAGLKFGNTVMGENIGVDYFLRIADVPFYEKKLSNGKILYMNAKTEKSIGYQTYRDFAQGMVDNWMKSPNHRKNILNKDFDRIGIGIAIGTYQNFQAIYVTQNFMGSIKPIDFP